MISSSRNAKVAALGFVLVAGLVLGGLTWATVASIQLERAQARAAVEADLNSRLRQALWRIDTLVMNVFAKEASRPYWHYSAYYYPSSVLLTTGEDLTGTIVQPSPLLIAQPEEDWILLHFQVSPVGGWSSPQVPGPDAWWVDMEDVDPREASVRQAFLSTLEMAYTPESFVALAASTEAARDPSRWLIGEDHADTVGERRDTQPPPRIAQARRQQAQQSDYRDRAGQTAYAQQVNRPPQVCDPAEVAFNNFLNVLTPEYTKENTVHHGFVTVTVSPMTPMWVRLPNRTDPLLAMVRVVEAEGNTVRQGFLVDWRKLSRLLLDRISGLFEQVELHVVEPETVLEPERTMTALPVKLVTQPVALAATTWWSRLDAALVFAWVFTLLALVAIGLGVRGLLTLTERRSQFAYAVTHELRTPLTTLCLYTDMLAEGLVASEKRDDYLLTLRAESQRLSDLVSGILEYSRVENRTAQFETRPTRFRELIDTVTDRHLERCQDAGMNLTVNVDGTDDVVLQTDPQLVAQILGNLIDNARKYANTGPSPTINLSATANRNEVTVEIADTGPGIRRADRRRVFKPFRRGRRQDAGASGGVGLGLALARSWARLLGGRLELCPTRPGRGAQFRLTLPKSP